ncbi:hypothetical protein D3C81_725890 [compost metagenome]
MQADIIDIGQGSHLELGAADDQQCAVIGTGVLGQVAHKRLDEAFEQHLFG